MGAAVKKHPDHFGAWVAGGLPSGERRKDDFYATPIECTVALLQHELKHIRRYTAGVSPIWEFACGDGAIGRPLERLGFTVIGTDLVYRGYGRGGVNVLGVNEAPAPVAISNPPFDIMEQIVDHLIRLDLPYFAILHKSTFWNTKKGAALWEKRMPTVTYKMLWRPSFTGGKSPTMNCDWTVFREPPPGGFPMTVPMHRPQAKKKRKAR